MMRTGPWVLVGGVALLCGGVASTGMRAWAQPEGPHVVPLQVAGVDTVDLRKSGIRTLKIASGQAAALEWGSRAYRGSAPDGQVSCRSQGRVLRCAMTGEISWGTTLRMPPQVRRVLADEYLEIEAKGDVGAVAVDTAGSLQWKGDAARLEIVSEASVPPRNGCGFRGEIQFESGKVGVLRVDATHRRLALDDLSQVGDIEVHAGPGLGLSVGDIAELKRIRIVETASAPSSTAPMKTCTAAEAASAAAAYAD